MTLPANQTPRAAAPVYAGLFLVTLATLMLELLLTRIFSVTMWYHYAFVAVSLALFGMTVGAVIVHVAPQWFEQEALPGRMALGAWLFGLSTALALVVHLAVPFVPQPTAWGVLRIAFVYAMLAVPFVCSGICVCLALTRFPPDVSRLYAADLVGAALGCLALAWVLGRIDGPSTGLAVGAVASAGGLAFAWGRPGRLRWLCAVTAVALVALAVANARTRTLRVQWAKGERELPPVYEKWNAFSRIAVWDSIGLPFGWGLSATYPKAGDVDQKMLVIDASAGTVLTRFEGDLGRLDYLPYDVTAIPYALRPAGRTLIIGAGGGRDILTALVFGGRDITAVEMNGDIADTVNRVFGDYTGHLDRIPGVRFVRAEARTHLAASGERYDVIQSSLTDTFAATAAGAFVLTENAIYTRQAWGSFLRHLTDRGVLSMSRWYHRRQPAETLRSVMLARAALDDLGVARPRRHVMVVRNTSRLPDPRVGIEGIATVLVSRSPFSDDDVATIEDLSRRLGFEIIVSPRSAALPEAAAALDAPDPEAYARAYLLDIAAPTDDRPFFFLMLHPRDIFHLGLFLENPAAVPTLMAGLVLSTLLLTVVVLAAIFIIGPLWLSMRRRRYRMESVRAGLVFFAAIGLGFMLIEISQMQRLMIYLGHPMYGLTVVLFALLVFSGLGSLAAGRLWPGGAGSGRPLGAMLVLLLVLAAFSLATPALVEAGRASATAGRIGLAVLALAPLGFVMGMPFPMGMRLAGLFPQAPTAWFWGVNGAMSVCGSVVAVIISLAWGISAAFSVGIACYALASLALWALLRRRHRAAAMPE